MQAHQVALFVVQKDAEKNEINDRAEFVSQTAKKSFYFVMRRDGARDPAQGMIARLRERLAWVGLVGGMHRTGR